MFSPRSRHIHFRLPTGIHLFSTQIQQLGRDMTSPLSFPNTEFHLANPPATEHVHIPYTRPLQHEPSRSALSAVCDCCQHRSVRPVLLPILLLRVRALVLASRLKLFAICGTWRPFLYANAICKHVAAVSLNLPSSDNSTTVGNNSEKNSSLIAIKTVYRICGKLLTTHFGRHSSTPGNTYITIY